MAISCKGQPPPHPPAPPFCSHPPGLNALAVAHASSVAIDGSQTLVVATAGDDQAVGVVTLSLYWPAVSQETGPQRAAGATHTEGRGKRGSPRLALRVLRSWRLNGAHGASVRGLGCLGGLVCTSGPDQRLRVWRLDVAAAVADDEACVSGGGSDGGTTTATTTASGGGGGGLRVNPAVAGDEESVGGGGGGGGGNDNALDPTLNAALCAAAANAATALATAHAHAAALCAAAPVSAASSSAASFTSDGGGGDGGGSRAIDNTGRGTRAIDGTGEGRAADNTGGDIKAARGATPLLTPVCCRCVAVQHVMAVAVLSLRRVAEAGGVGGAVGGADGGGGNGGGGEGGGGEGGGGEGGGGGGGGGEGGSAPDASNSSFSPVSDGEKVASLTSSMGATAPGGGSWMAGPVPSEAGCGAMEAVVAVGGHGIETVVVRV